MMGMFEMMAMASSGLLVMVIPGFALPFLYIYLVHDYAGRRQGNRDPLLGSKVFTTLMMTLAAQLVLAGAALVLVSIVGDGSSEDLFKTGLGFMLAGAVVGVFPAILYYTRVRTHAGARVAHQALGLNALLFGIVFTAMVIMASQGIFHEEEVAEPLSVAALYGAAMIFAGVRLQQSPILPARVETDG